MDGGAKMGLWRITESEAELAALTEASDVASCAGFASEKRRLERLAWRVLARRMLPPGVEFSYNAAGAPIVSEGGFLSVSHCGGYAAVVCSPQPCAIDIESLGRNFGRVAGRFVSASERELDEAWGEGFECMVWCAKEAMYKYAGVDGLDFLKDLRLTAAYRARSTAAGEIRGRAVSLGVAYHGEICVVYIVAGE